MASRTHYELLRIDPSADAEAIKTAFRRQIARYHPDKVMHLGQEFQDLAADLAAELTSAYKTLIDQALRRDYDAGLRQEGQPEQPASPQPIASSGFDAERAGYDGIVQRAVIRRVENVVARIYGAVQARTVRGFDLVLVPIDSPSLLRSPYPRVFVRRVDVVDALEVRNSWSNAVRARVHVPRSPINILLFGKQIAPARDLFHACEGLRRQRTRPDQPQKVHVVAFDAADWTAHMAPDAPPGLRRFVERLQNP
jgi:curved DNA-binding protein CbpA